MKKQHEKMILWSIIVISVLSVVPLLHLSMYNLRLETITGMHQKPIMRGEIHIPCGRCAGRHLQLQPSFTRPGRDFTPPR